MCTADSLPLIYFPEMLPCTAGRVPEVHSEEAGQAEQRHVAGKADATQLSACFLNPGLPTTTLSAMQAGNTPYYTPDNLPLSPAAARAWLEQTLCYAHEHTGRGTGDIITREWGQYEDFYTGTTQALQSALNTLANQQKQSGQPKHKTADTIAPAPEKNPVLHAQHLLLLAHAIQQTHQQLTALEQTVVQSWQAFDEALGTDPADRTALQALSGGAFAAPQQQTTPPASLLPPGALLRAFFQVLPPEIPLFVQDKSLLKNWQEQGVTFVPVPDNNKYASVCLPGTVFFGLPYDTCHTMADALPRTLYCPV